MTEDETLDDIPLSSPYDAGPPTIQERLSPFHTGEPSGSTIQGMPAAQLSAPVITSKPTGEPGVGAPQIINAPAQGAAPTGALPPDGATVPEGFPSLMALAPPPPSPSDFGPDELPTDPYAGRHVRGSVPSPEAPNIQISKSMEYDVRHLEEGPPPDPRQVPRVAAARRAVAQPTEVMLPALGRKKKKERSDAWLVLGLIFLVLVILGLVGAVIFGVLQRV